MIVAGLQSRFGLACVVGAVLGMVIAGLLVSRANLRADLADAEGKVAALSADIALQNAAVEKMQADGLAASQAASARAAAALKPKPKPSTKTIEELNQWLVSP